MGANTGVIMLRVLGMLSTVALVATSHSERAATAPYGLPDDAATVVAAPAIDVTALLTAARGAPPIICGLAAQSLGNGNWGWGSDIPAPPLGTAGRQDSGDRRRMEDLSDADVTRALDALSSDDACVREVGGRIVGHQDDKRVAAPLIAKLSASNASLRAVAAIGLGLAEPSQAVDPLVSALRDATVDVRANSAWALGRIENGRALRPLEGLFQ